MKFLRLLIRNLLRNKRRTFLTISSIGVSLFLIATLQTLLTELQNPPETPDSALRLITRHRISLFNALPAAHAEKIREIEGVEAVAGTFWFGGIYQDPSNFFANFSADTGEFFQVYPDLEIPEEQKEAFLEDRTGALVGKNLADRFGWELGDTVFLESMTWPIDVELKIRGIYEGGSDLATTLYFHWEYYNELMKQEFGEWDNQGTFAVRISEADQAEEVAERIDASFRNSSFPTKTETEKAFLLGFVSMLGDIQFLITSIVSVVIFTIVLVAANTMAMSIRERTREIGILKALGFRSRQVMGLLMGEAVLLSLIGAAVGAFLAKFIFSSIPLAQITAGFIQRFYVTPGTILLCLAIGVFVGILSAGFPAWQASRRSVLEALRRVV